MGKSENEREEERQINGEIREIRAREERSPACRRRGSVGKSEQRT